MVNFFHKILTSEASLNGKFPTVSCVKIREFNGNIEHIMFLCINSFLWAY